MIALTVFAPLILETFLSFVVRTLQPEFIWPKRGVSRVFRNNLLRYLSFGFTFTGLDGSLGSLLPQVTLYLHASDNHRIFNRLTVSHVLKYTDAYRLVTKQLVK